MGYLIMLAGVIMIPTLYTYSPWIGVGVLAVGGAMVIYSGRGGRKG